MFYSNILKQICSLVKRGIEDTNTPGGNGEVQVYFEGAVKILEEVDTLDPVILFCGRITLDDMKLSRVQRVVRREGVLLPEFARNIFKYKKQLRKISLANGIEDLKMSFIKLETDATKQCKKNRRKKHKKIVTSNVTSKVLKLPEIIAK